MTTLLIQVARKWLSDIRWFSRLVIRRELYSYQLEPAKAIVDSVIHSKGLEFAIMFPRQSGKNETQAQIEAYLLNLYQRVGGQIVKASPTWKPQSINAIMRLERTLRNDWNKNRWQRIRGYMIQMGEALIAFFSADPSASVVGATASLLLQCDEAQDVIEAQWNKSFLPMAASTNATVVYWGTAWTSRTLLARTIRYLHTLEALDGIKRVFVVTPEQVTADNQTYGQFVARQVQKLGRNHPLVRTQYYNEEIDAEGGMFPPARQQLMQGSHPRRSDPEPDTIYCLLLDVAGEDESATGDTPLDENALTNPKRDSTALTVIEVDLSTMTDPLIRAPTYRAVDRRLWTGVKHTALYGQIRTLADHWRARHVVVDATGVGAGLASFLDSALPGKVIPFTFTGPTKSQLGWNFLAVVETGRWQDWQALPGDAESAAFWQQLQFCQHEIRPGPGRSMRWSVPDGTRDPTTGELVHDDLIISAALCSVLDEQTWPTGGPVAIIQGRDPLADIDRQGFQ